MKHSHFIKSFCCMHEESVTLGAHFNAYVMAVCLSILQFWITKKISSTPLHQMQLYSGDLFNTHIIPQSISIEFFCPRLIIQKSASCPHTMLLCCVTTILLCLIPSVFNCSTQSTCEYVRVYRYMINNSLDLALAPFVNESKSKKN